MLIISSIAILEECGKQITESQSPTPSTNQTNKITLHESYFKKRYSILIITLLKISENLQVQSINNKYIFHA